MQETSKDVSDVLNEMITYYSGDVKRINHFLKVHSFAKIIGESENIDLETLKLLELAAAVHDIGIKVSEEKYNSSSGKYQEIEGPAIAKDLLSRLDFPDNIIDRVVYLVGNHHSYNKIDGIDFQILVEADFLVNCHEDQMSKSSIETVKSKYFVTKTGKKLLNNLYL